MHSMKQQYILRGNAKTCKHALNVEHAIRAYWHCLCSPYHHCVWWASSCGTRAYSSRYASLSRQDATSACSEHQFNSQICCVASVQNCCCCCLAGWAASANFIIEMDRCNHEQAWKEEQHGANMSMSNMEPRTHSLKRLRCHHQILLS